ncbi:hypothetical protein ISN74_12175 [Dyella caseinilytica]|uniref:Uncharacterized protein n=1 Tax=Dyella caseinilytica TaxID=1849581 RepID=A0ABX7GQB0_9GAMM|nr:hypothetical protein [Dyella caseinilytica]QRN52246.1 hypothetical protein ISN74_12175 [Dyella caseinilytica]
MTTATPRTIAERKLTYARKGEAGRTPFSVCVSEPFLLTPDNSDVEFADGAAGCVLSFEGLSEKARTIHGGDAVQALELAIGSIDSHLKWLSKKYDFYFPDGEEPYFEE